VLIHPGRLQDVLQHQLTGPSALPGISENHSEALYLRHRFIEPGLDLTLRLQDGRTSLCLPARDQPHDERTEQNSDNKRDDDRRHGMFPSCRAAASCRPALSYGNDAHRHFRLLRHVTT
jgi:hypothetical protein